MSPLAVGTSVLVCVFGGALAGMFLTQVLPKEHLSASSRDVVKVATAMIATLAALVVGLLVASAKTSFDTKQTEFTQLSAEVIVLDRELAQYGPATGPARSLLRQIVVTRLRQIWPDETGGLVEVKAISQGEAIEMLQATLRGLDPSDDGQRYLKAKMLATSDDIAEARWLLFEQVRSTIQWPFLTVVVFWLAILFLSFGLSAPRNATVVVALFVSALSVAAAIF